MFKLLEKEAQSLLLDRHCNALHSIHTNYIHACSMPVLISGGGLFSKCVVKTQEYLSRGTTAVKAESKISIRGRMTLFPDYLRPAVFGLGSGVTKFAVKVFIY